MTFINEQLIFLLIISCCWFSFMNMLSIIHDNDEIDEMDDSDDSNKDFLYPLSKEDTDIDDHNDDRVFDKNSTSSKNVKKQATLSPRDNDNNVKSNNNNDNDNKKHTSNSNSNGNSNNNEEDASSLFSNSDSLPIFLKEPKDAFVVKNKPALLQCQAANTLQIYFKCNGVRNVAVFQTEFVDPQTGIRIVEAECNVTRNMVEEFFAKEKFKCECFAWNGRGSIKSQSAIIEVAYLKKQFEMPPVSTRVQVGQQTEIRCLPPTGMPAPRVSWLKNGQPLPAADSTQSIVTSEGHLLIGHTKDSDSGNYTCVAENVAAKRFSSAAQLTVFVNGGWSSWSQWIDCKCPSSSFSPSSLSNNYTFIIQGQKRTRTCTNPTPVNSGLFCQGSSTQKTDDCIQCSPQEAKWSAWSEWSLCNSDCIKTRKRTCLLPITMHSYQGKVLGCTGRDSQTTFCSDREQNCRSKKLTGIHEVTLMNAQTDFAIYVGLSLAILMLSMLSVLLIRIYKKKNQHQSLYTMTANDYQQEFFPDLDKKSIAIQQPDLTPNVLAPSYEYPYRKPKYFTSSSNNNNNCIFSMNNRSALSEHHYDVPHLTSASDIIQLSSTSNSTIETSNSSGKRSQLSSFTNSIEKEDKNSLPTAYAITSTESSNFTNSIITNQGGFLSLVDNNVSLLIPEGTITKVRKNDVFLSILSEDCYRPKLSENVTQLSPIISCGPNLNLNKSVVIKMPHCAESVLDEWQISVLVSDFSDSQWKQVATAGYDSTANVFCQIDASVAYVVSDYLARFVLVGRALSSNACKRFKLAIFGPKLISQSAVDIRVYVLEDFDCFLKHVYNEEWKLGGRILCEPKSIQFYESDMRNLCLELENLSDGWSAKPGSAYQEIPFRHLWQANSNSVHCSFSLDNLQRFKSLQFAISVRQSERLEDSVKFHVDLDGDIVNEVEPPQYWLHTSPSVPFSNSLVEKDGQVRTKNEHVRLNCSIRRQLCQSLDPISTRANDWRMFACRILLLDYCLATPTRRQTQQQQTYYMNYLASKSSPTDSILNLWEARNQKNGIAAIAELVRIFRDMERLDCVSILEASGPNWL